MFGVTAPHPPFGHLLPAGEGVPCSSFILHHSDSCLPAWSPPAWRRSFFGKRDLRAITIRRRGSCLTHRSHWPSTPACHPFGRITTHGSAHRTPWIDYSINRRSPHPSTSPNARGLLFLVTFIP